MIRPPAGLWSAESASLQDLLHTPSMTTSYERAFAQRPEVYAAWV